MLDPSATVDHWLAAAAFPALFTISKKKIYGFVVSAIQLTTRDKTSVHFV